MKTSLLANSGYLTMCDQESNSRTKVQYNSIFFVCPEFPVRQLNNVFKIPDSKGMSLMQEKQERRTSVNKNSKVATNK